MKNLELESSGLSQLLLEETVLVQGGIGGSDGEYGSGEDLYRLVKYVSHEVGDVFRGLWVALK